MKRIIIGLLILNTVHVFAESNQHNQPKKAEVRVKEDTSRPPKRVPRALEERMQDEIYGVRLDETLNKKD